MLIYVVMTLKPFPPLFVACSRAGPGFSLCRAQMGAFRPAPGPDPLSLLCDDAGGALDDELCGERPDSQTAPRASWGSHGE